MRKFIYVAVLMICGLGLFSGCATTQTWPDYERSADDKMAAIQTKIGDGLRTGALTPDQSQMYLSRLKEIRLDADELRGKMVHRETWTGINTRLDALDADLTSAIGRSTTRMPEYRNDDKIVMLQKRIDEGRLSGRLSATDQRDFQARLDSIRQDNMRLTDGGRTPTYNDSAEIAHRLDNLEMDLNRYR